MTDEHLVLRTQSGDLDAFNDLVARWEAELYRFLRRHLGNREDALDLCQETMVKAYLHIEGLREGSKFKTWLYQIALNLCRDRFRSGAAKRIAQPFDEAGAEEIAVISGKTAASAPDRGADLRALLDEVERVLGELPEEQCTAILLREYQGLTSEEIGEITGVPAATVRTRVFYGLKAARRMLLARGLMENGT